MLRKTCVFALFILLHPAALAQQGEWEEVFPFGVPLDPSLQEIAPVHLIHTFDGETPRVVAITYVDIGNQAAEPCCLANAQPSCLQQGQSPSTVPKIYLWTFPPPNSAGNPGTFESIPWCGTDLFCAGHSALSDGRILTVGGTLLPGTVNGSYDANYFYPDQVVGDQWNTLFDPDDMTHGRWYPTATTLGDGRVLVCSGVSGDQTGYVPIAEIYNPSTNAWTALTSSHFQELYPTMFLLPDGNLVDAGQAAGQFNGLGRLLISSNWTWGATIQNPTWPPGHIPPGVEGSAVMYEPGKIMKCGGESTTGAAVATTYVIDLNGMNPSNPPRWLAAGNMVHARLHHNLVLLPDGKVLAVGGNEEENTSPIFHAEIFDPRSGAWTEQPESDPDEPRVYHSTAMLLPDGRVVSAGSNNFPTAQFFKPPYITSGAPRPVIGSAPTYMQYDSHYTIEYTGPKAVKACLIRLAAVTHGFDQDQRYVPLTIVTADETSAYIASPDNGNVAPPGNYMLFILSNYAVNQYAPCTMAKYVRVGP